MDWWFLYHRHSFLDFIIVFVLSVLLFLSRRRCHGTVATRMGLLNSLVCALWQDYSGKTQYTWSILWPKAWHTPQILFNSFLAFSLPKTAKQIRPTSFQSRQLAREVPPTWTHDVVGLAQIWNRGQNFFSKSLFEWAKFFWLLWLGCICLFSALRLRLPNGRNEERLGRPKTRMWLWVFSRTSRKC